MNNTNKNPFTKVDGFLFVGSTQVFTYSEDSYALPLTSELDALCGENVNWILLR